MKIKLSTGGDFARNRRAFTFIEVMIATLITLVMFTAFFAAMTLGVQTTRVSRENLRATQIMVSRMEGIRLFTWDQLTNTSLLPTNFTTSFYPNGTNGNQGITYTGTVSVLPATLSPSPSYASNLYQVTIQLTWQSTGPVHKRQISTYCAKYGVQNYVWSSD
jgi:Tfp pilus assembly protein PilV